MTLFFAAKHLIQDRACFSIPFQWSCNGRQHYTTTRHQVNTEKGDVVLLYKAWFALSLYFTEQSARREQQIIKEESKECDVIRYVSTSVN